jgi:hypothetical protein
VEAAVVAEAAAAAVAAAKTAAEATGSSFCDKKRKLVLQTRR